MKQLKKDLLEIRIHETRDEMGKDAASGIAACIRTLLAEKTEVNLVFAAAPSQNEVLAALVADKTIPWERVNAFHMDEYVGLPVGAPQTFGSFLREHIFAHVPVRSVHYINAAAEDADAECLRYAELLRAYPTDVVVMGIGENGHVAFNDPPVADFCDPKAVKTVELDPICRNQQVHDGCFKTLSDVPTTAITLTVPSLTAGKHLFCIVPAKTKAEAVRATLLGEISEVCPASVLRRHPSAVLYLDGDSSALLPEVL